MSPQPIQIIIDDRVRLMSAALAGTNWPEGEQTRRRYRAHNHARLTARRVRDCGEHPAVHTLQTQLDRGTPLSLIYTYALSLSWPDLKLQAPQTWAPAAWTSQLYDFREAATLAGWWADEDEVWQRAVEQISRIVTGTDFYSFFRPFVGDLAENLLIMPNVSYPSDSEIGVRLDGKLLCVIPPRIAWGDNEPWPFNEDPAHVFRGAVAAYGRVIMAMYLRRHAAEIAPLVTIPWPVDDSFRVTHATWGDQLTELFAAGSVALFLEQAIGRREAEAYLLMENRLHGLTILPSVVSVLKRYLADRDQGQYNELADYLPNFGEHLRIAARSSSH